MQNEIIQKLAVALKTLTNSSSKHIGADCMAHAKLAQHFLLEEGVETRLVVGEAAWRVGPGDSDVIAHSPALSSSAPIGYKAMAYHAWLEIGSHILDFSTHSLRTKGADLDALDGGNTSVLWCPLFILEPIEKSLTLNEVVAAPREGVFFYRELPGLYEYMVSQGLEEDIDKTDAQVLRVIFSNPELNVIGVNDLSKCDKTVVEIARKSILGSLFTE